MSTFDEIRRITNVMAKDICESTGVKISLVINVIQYARRLCRPTNPDFIEELVFIAQMGQRFGITSTFHVKLMFDAIRVKDTKQLKVEDFARLICVFYSKKLDVKIDFVFSVYDFYHDHHISPQEMTALLKTAIVSAGDDDAIEQLKELIEMVLLVFDMDGDGVISLEEFRHLVHKNILYIQLLGQVLPHKEVIDAFMDNLKNKTPLAVRNQYTHERTDCLNEPRAKDTKDDLYPVILELP
ncbi:hypothetical protein RRG08_008188 [Elysia crispata]|uniref:EF-hand domain-containing protein n=1 Tax=Elysia crispata TaxID=231223 RepID=A0AAE1DTM6_9GAST|nr:hypothetical protein RRG08_008188 [Elysia crispata]